MRKFAIAVMMAAAVCTGQEADDLEAKVDKLRKEIADLHRLLSESLEREQQPAPAAAPQNALAATYEEGFYTLSGPEGRVQFGGYAQFDGRWPREDALGESEIKARRIRPEARGELPNDFAWRMQGELAGSSAGLVDGSMEYRGWAHGTPKVGQFKEPFGLEALYSPAHLDFLERSMIATAFSPLQDIGAGVSGHSPGGRVWYGAGLFNGRGKNIEENNNDKDVAGRVQLTPFAGGEGLWLSGLSFGASATRGEQDESLKGVSYKSAARVPFFTYAPDAAEDGSRERWGTDVEWYVGPVSVKAEWIRLEQQMVYSGSTNENAVFDGWAVSASWMLTGEDKPRNRPLRDVGLGGGSWGAWELALRVEEFNTDDGLLETGLALGTDRAMAYTAGVNWYPNAHVRVMLNGVHVDYDDEITADGKTDDEEDVALLRFQYAL